MKGDKSCHKIGCSNLRPHNSGSFCKTCTSIYAKAHVALNTQSLCSETLNVEPCPHYRSSGRSYCLYHSAIKDHDCTVYAGSNDCSEENIKRLTEDAITKALPVMREVKKKYKFYIGQTHDLFHRVAVHHCSERDIVKMVPLLSDCSREQALLVFSRITNVSGGQLRVHRREKSSPLTVNIYMIVERSNEQPLRLLGVEEKKELARIAAQAIAFSQKGCTVHIGITSDFKKRMKHYDSNSNPTYAKRSKAEEPIVLTISSTSATAADLQDIEQLTIREVIRRRHNNTMNNLLGGEGNMQDLPPGQFYYVYFRVVEKYTPATYETVVRDPIAPPTAEDILKYLKWERKTEGTYDSFTYDKFDCQIKGCAKSYKSKLDLRRHIKEVHDEETFDCPFCELKYTRKPTLRDHIKSKHQDEYQQWHKENKFVPEKEFRCQIEGCAKSYNKKKLLLVHIKEKHDGKTFNCPFCGSKHKQKPLLCDHIRSRHRDEYQQWLKDDKLVPEKEFRCQIENCGKSYAHKSDLRRHIRGVHDGKTFDCPFCESKYTQKPALRDHIKIWHPKEYQQWLKDDKFVPEKEFRCPVKGCGKSYKTKKILRVHTKTMH